ncbi:MAG: hypothetical protein J0M04_09050 [Verrucomicrobia bacterium]|nr:hypothetical protein [Verrucomicrobiota bacterium]
MQGFLLFPSCLALAAVAAAADLAVVEEHGDRDRRINFVFLSEGYTAAEMGKFATDTAAAVDVVFNREPWREYRPYFNIYRIEVASAQSGCDYGDTSGPSGTRDTWFETGFTVPEVSQWIAATPIGEDRAYGLLDEWVPEYDIAVILVNDAKYGGTGGPIAVVTTHPLGAAVIEHELGHSFGNLADEYDQDLLDKSPAEAPNNTEETLRDFVRWKHWFESATPVPTPETEGFSSTVGLFEGSMYRATGWYRPHLDSVMRHLNRLCGAVNREQLVLSAYALVNPLDGWSPETGTRYVHGSEILEFTLNPKAPAGGGGPLVIEWKVDGAVRAETGNGLAVLSDELGDGYHTVTARVGDATPFVRNDPSGLLAETLEWAFHLTGQPPGTIDAWRAAYGPDLTVLSGDGLCNLVKYALGVAADRPAGPDERPYPAWFEAGGRRYPGLTIQRRFTRPDVAYVVETSDDLVTWRSGGGHTEVVRDESTVLEVRSAIPADESGRQFMRLRITAPR